ncbi:hypothetical protein [Natronorubrum daqingense]|uniref:MYXO-CTERM domain-containing protein n=1 Tax=Natronorubrum daqingense TaxID=588898 RepID=A0A1N7DPC9_9EURY|nr:hypothetical protein [Natronorubrum daqingense]APX96091.1 hypothetical protein BB347_05355 [Natronorubrum daqingense]SIR77621.1 hypothetical protein SAMN05421809_2153 [Natronorubrum daqingense]
MPTTEEQDETLSEIVVREAVGMGLESPLRDSILEAVEDAEGKTGSDRNLPLAGALFGIGSALGFLAGRRSHELEVGSLEDIDEPDIIQNALEETRASDEGMMGGDEEGMTDETDAEVEDGGGSSKIGKLILTIGLVAGIAILRQRLSSDEKEEWEPIEEFEPATDDESDEDADDESEDDAMEAEAEAESGDEETEE